MEGGGEMKTNVSRSTGTDSPSARCDDRAAAFRYVSERIQRDGTEEEEQEEDLCFDILSTFINSLGDQQWESIRERSREPLTQAHLAQVSRRIVRVVSELVLQVLVPALMSRLRAQDTSESSSSKSSKDSGSSAVKGRPYIKESSGSQSSDRCMLGKVVQPERLYALAALKCAAEVQSSSTNSSGSRARALAKVASWHDIERFLDAATGEVMTVIIKSFSCQERTAGAKRTDSAAYKILKDVAIKMRFSERQTPDEFDQESLHEYHCCCLGYLGKKLQNCTSKVKGSLTKSQKVDMKAKPEDRNTTYPMSVSSEEVAIDLSCSKFRENSLNALKEFLRTSLLMFPLDCIEGKDSYVDSVDSVDSVASKMHDIVVNSVTKLCQPQPRQFSWQQSENTIVSEEKVASSALMLKFNLQVILQNFLTSHKEASDKLKEVVKEEARRSLSELLSSRSDESAEDTLKGSVHSTPTTSCESSIKSMTKVVQSFLEEAEQSLKEDSSKSSEAVTGFEELISQDKLFTFSKVLADKLAGMFQEQTQSAPRSLDPNRKGWSDSELNKPTRGPVGIIMPSDQVYVFVEETVKHLLTSLIFPPPSWGMGHMIQVQSDASAAANWAESVEKYEAVIGFYSELMADQVMGTLSRTSASSRVRQEVTGPQKKKIHFFQELPSKIRRNWNTLTHKED
ncbi:uncharacterized protein LOC115005911 [Cottoperca gobio]|uniref:Uncharacterized protein LOC115005911 n=1 Tax=Cottoperca gobio TaxID=56716 RepID=A0A6J2PCB1_COTGO|nr:uncharacterized protein LOC115005911 [Cottoperca gobio]